jgi:hypothetical protein
VVIVSVSVLLGTLRVVVKTNPGTFDMLVDVMVTFAIVVVEVAVSPIGF